MCMQKYYKKADGSIIEVNSNHDINSLNDRFTECDANGNELKKEAPKKASKKKEGK